PGKALFIGHGLDRASVQEKTLSLVQMNASAARIEATLQDNEDLTASISPWQPWLGHGWANPDRGYLKSGRKPGAARRLSFSSAGGFARFWLSGSRRLSWPVHDMVRIIGKPDLFFRYTDTTLNGNPRLMHAHRRSRDERMPPGKIAALGNQPVGAGRRQPAKASHGRRSQFDAITHPAVAVRIIGAAAGSHVEKLAGDVGEMNFTAILVLQLDKAAAAASIAETFPFGGVQGFERLCLPERRWRGTLGVFRGFY